jgi:hypothetical protein
VEWGGKAIDKQSCDLMWLSVIVIVIVLIDLEKGPNTEEKS